MRHIWITRRHPVIANMLTRIGYCRKARVRHWFEHRAERGQDQHGQDHDWAPRGERLVGHAPFSHWQTQTFIAALGTTGWMGPG